MRQAGHSPPLGGRYQRLWAATAISNIGNGVLYASVPLLAQTVTSSPTAISIVTVAQAFAAFSLLDVTIKTGRTHQIRVHLASNDHPIVGDDKYGDFALNKALARGEAVLACPFDRMFLHAKRLRFAHPATQQDVELLAPLPAECASLLTALQALLPP